MVQQISSQRGKITMMNRNGQHQDHSTIQNTKDRTSAAAPTASCDTADTDESSHDDGAGEESSSGSCQENQVTTNGVVDNNNNKKKRLRWADESCCCCCSNSSPEGQQQQQLQHQPLVTVYQLQEDSLLPESSLRIVILLLDAASKQFEFVHVEVELMEQELNVSDVLAQLPGLAAAGSVFQKSEFEALFQYTVAHDDDVLQTTATTTFMEQQQEYKTLQDYDLQNNGEILLALTKQQQPQQQPPQEEEEGCSMQKDTTTCAPPTAFAVAYEFAQTLLTDKVRQAVQRACRVGRALQTLYSSTEWETVKQRQQIKQLTGGPCADDRKEDNQEEAEAIWIGILLLHPATKQFEVLHCEFWDDEVVRVADVLQQLPRLAVSRPTFTDTNFVALRRPFGDDDDANEAFEPILTLQEYAVQSGEVLIALTEHGNANSLRKTRSFLKATLPMLKLAVHRGHRTKKARHALLSCEQWAALSSLSSTTTSTGSSNATASSSNSGKSTNHLGRHYDTLLTPEQLAAFTSSTTKPPAVLTVPDPNKLGKKKKKKRKDKDSSSKVLSKGRGEQHPKQKLNQVESSLSSPMTTKSATKMSTKQPLQAILTPAPTPIFRQFSTEASLNVTGNSLRSENTCHDRILSICKVIPVEQPSKGSVVTKKSVPQKNVKPSSSCETQTIRKNKKARGLRSLFRSSRLVQDNVENRIEQVQA